MVVSPMLKQPKTAPPAREAAGAIGRTTQTGEFSRPLVFAGLTGASGSKILSGAGPSGLTNHVMAHNGTNYFTADMAGRALVQDGGSRNGRDPMESVEGGGRDAADRVTRVRQNGRRPQGA